MVSRSRAKAATTSNGAEKEPDSPRSKGVGKTDSQRSKGAGNTLLKSVLTKTIRNRSQTASLQDISNRTDTNSLRNNESKNTSNDLSSSSLDTTGKKRGAALAAFRAFQEQETPRTTMQNFIDVHEESAVTPAAFFSKQHRPSEGGSYIKSVSAINASELISDSSNLEQEGFSAADISSDVSSIEAGPSKRRGQRKRKAAVTADEMDPGKDITQPLNKSNKTLDITDQVSDSSSLDETARVPRNKRKNRKKFEPSDFDFSMPLPPPEPKNKSKASNSTKLDISDMTDLSMDESMEAVIKIRQRKQSRKKKAVQISVADFSVAAPDEEEQVESKVDDDTVEDLEIREEMKEKTTSIVTEISTIDSKKKRKREDQEPACELKPPKMAKMDAKTEEDPLHYCHEVVKELLSKKKENIAWPFYKPVDPELNPDYYDKIKTPIDLSTIEEKLRNTEYSTVKEFEQDVSMMFNNCRKYNDPDETIVKNANKLEKFFLTRMSKMGNYTEALVQNLQESHERSPVKLCNASITDDNIDKIRCEKAKKQLRFTQPRFTQPREDGIMFDEEFEESFDFEEISRGNKSNDYVATTAVDQNGNKKVSVEDYENAANDPAKTGATKSAMSSTIRTRRNHLATPAPPTKDPAKTGATKSTVSSTIRTSRKPTATPAPTATTPPATPAPPATTPPATLAPPATTPPATPAPPATTPPATPAPPATTPPATPTPPATTPPATATPHATSTPRNVNIKDFYNSEEVLVKISSDKSLPLEHRLHEALLSIPLDLEKCSTEQLSEWYDYIYETMGFDPSITHSTLFGAVASQSNGAICEVNAVKGHYSTNNLHLVEIGGKGIGKSGGRDLVIKPLLEIEEELVASFRKDHDMHLQASQQAENTPKKDSDSSPAKEKPFDERKGRFILQSGTAEGMIASMMNSYNDDFIGEYDEGSVLLKMMWNKDGDTTSFASRLQSLFGSKETRVSTVRAGDMSLKNATLQLVAAVQPEIFLDHYAKDCRDAGGSVDRITFTMVKPNDITLRQQDENILKLEKIVYPVKRLLKTVKEIHPTRNIAWPLTKTAMELIYQLDENMTEDYKADKTGAVRPMNAKAMEKVYRLALNSAIIRVCERYMARQDEAGEEDVEFNDAWRMIRSIDVARAAHFVQHSNAVFWAFREAAKEASTSLTHEITVPAGFTSDLEDWKKDIMDGQDKYKHFEKVIGIYNFKPENEAADADKVLLKEVATDRKHYVRPNWKSGISDKEACLLYFRFLQYNGLGKVLFGNKEDEGQVANLNKKDYNKIRFQLYMEEDAMPENGSETMQLIMQKYPDFKPFE